MVLIVTMASGDRIPIELALPVTVSEFGEHLNLIQDANGVDHYFTKAGYYDGWGKPMFTRLDEGDR